MESNGKPLVSIVILSLNRHDDLKLTLDKVSKLDYPYTGIIVVDNPSRHETRGSTVEDGRSDTLFRDEGKGVIGFPGELEALDFRWNRGAESERKRTSCPRGFSRKH